MDGQMVASVARDFRVSAKTVHKWVAHASVADAQAAITRYLNDRNSSFAIAPRRAGQAIWGQERVPAAFTVTNNCKDSRYR
jgi:hypothetical protein